MKNRQNNKRDISQVNEENDQVQTYLPKKKVINLNNAQVKCTKEDCSKTFGDDSFQALRILNNSSKAKPVIAFMWKNLQGFVDAVKELHNPDRELKDPIPPCPFLTLSHLNISPKWLKYAILFHAETSSGLCMVIDGLFQLNFAQLSRLCSEFHALYDDPWFQAVARAAPANVTIFPLAEVGITVPRSEYMTDCFDPSLPRANGLPVFCGPFSRGSSN
jgi:hypothetical protein